MRKARALICALLTLLLLSGCGGGGVTEDTSNESETSPSETSENLPLLVDAGVAVFNIVYPDSPGAERYAEVRELAACIKEYTGAEPKLVSDFLRRGETHDSSTPEILVGLTNYDETAAVLSTLRHGEYAIRMVGQKLVIVGQGDEAISRAISYFCKNLVKPNIVTGDDGRISLMVKEYTYMVTPAIESLTIGGIGIEKFSIVYATNIKGYEAAATALRDLISERCGYVLKVDSDKAAATEHEILIGPTNRAESALFAVKYPAGLLSFSMGSKGGKYVINAEPYTAKLAASRFSSRYLYDNGKNVSISASDIFSDSYIKTPAAPLAAGADLRIMTANILAEFASWGAPSDVYARAEIFASLLEVYSPDVVGLQEITPQWDEMIPYYSSDKYEFIHMKTPDGLFNYSTIIYRKDKISVIDSGVMYFSTEGKNNIRLVTWGVFENKNDHSRFILFNTHWCWDTVEHARIQATEEAALIKQVTEKYNYPYFCTADYNTKQFTDNYNLFLELTGAVDAKYAANDAGVLLNTAGGCGNVGTPRGEGGNSIDHIFMSPTVNIFAFETVVGNNTWDLSDHSPKYADVKLN